MTDALASKAARPQAVLTGGADHSEGMSYLESLPRAAGDALSAARADHARAAVPVLLDGIDRHQTRRAASEPSTASIRFGPGRRPSSTFRNCCLRPIIRSGCGTRPWSPWPRPFCPSSRACSRAYAIVRLRYRGAQWVGGAIFLAYLIPPSILFIPLSTVVFQYGLFDTPFALILTYPTILIPFSTWLLMGYFKTIPFELEECALIDGASRWQILTKIVLPLAIPGLISAFIFCFTLCWNEFIYALTFISSSQHKTVPVAIVNEFVDGDIYRWGSLMAGALVGSLPLVVLYAFFVEHYVSAMTGAVKE